MYNYLKERLLDTFDCLNRNKNKNDNKDYVEKVIDEALHDINVCRELLKELNSEDHQYRTRQLMELDYLDYFVGDIYSDFRANRENFYKIKSTKKYILVEENYYKHTPLFLKRGK